MNVNWLSANPFEGNPRKQPEVGSIVRYVGVQNPELAGMEGVVTSWSADQRYWVEWKGRPDMLRGPFTWHDLKVLRGYTKRFR